MHIYFICLISYMDHAWSTLLQSRWMMRTIQRGNKVVLKWGWKEMSPCCTVLFWAIDEKANGKESAFFRPYYVQSLALYLNRNNVRNNNSPNAFLCSGQSWGVLYKTTQRVSNNVLHKMWMWETLHIKRMCNEKRVLTGLHIVKKAVPTVAGVALGCLVPLLTLMADIMVCGLQP